VKCSLHLLGWWTLLNDERMLVTAILEVCRLDASGGSSERLEVVLRSNEVFDPSASQMEKAYHACTPTVSY
jgi:hypothetical protein